MTNQFSAPKLKIARAKRHITEFEESIPHYLATNSAKASATVEGNTVKWAFEYTGSPAEWGPIVGDVIHNLRSALDLAAVECVRLNGGDDREVYFPFAGEEASLDKMIFKRGLGRAHPSVVSFVKSLRPFKGGNALLRALHDLDVQDKHHAIIPTGVSYSGPIISLWNDAGEPEISVVGDPNTPSQISFVFPAGTAFAGHEVIPTLHEFVGLVDGIVDALMVIAGD